MERVEAIRTDTQPTLGGGPAIGVSYVGRPPMPTADAPDRDPRMPYAAPELLARFDQLLVEAQQLTQAVYLATPQADTVVRERLLLTVEHLCEQTLVLRDLHDELQNLRADLRARTFAARMQRFGRWLKGLVTWQ